MGEKPGEGEEGEKKESVQRGVVKNASERQSDRRTGRCPGSWAAVLLRGSGRPSRQENRRRRQWMKTPETAGVGASLEKPDVLGLKRGQIGKSLGEGDTCGLC